MAVAFRAKSDNGGASGGDLTVNRPTGTADNDILIADCYSEGSGTAFTLPAGWAWVAAAVQNTNVNFWHRIAWKRASSEPASWTFAHSPSAWRNVVVSAWSGAITSGDPQDSTAASNNDSGNTPLAAAISNGTANSMNIALASSYNQDNYGASSSGYTDGGNFVEMNLFYAIQSASGSSGTKTFTAGSASGNWTTWHISIKEATSATLEQEGFRFGVDDGSESAHAWAAAQDTNVTTTVNTILLRILTNATGDPASMAPTLRYQKNGAGGYTPVPVGATTVTSPPAAPTATVTTVGTAGSPWSINRPAASSGDTVVFVIAWDDSTDVTSVTAPAGVNSETAVSIAGPRASASTEMRIQAWYYVATGAWSTGTLSFTPSASETCRAVAFVIPSGQYKSGDVIGWADTAASAGTAESNLSSPAGTAESDDGNGRLYIAYGSDADAITVPGSNWNTINNATGGGVGLAVGTRNTLVSNSESITALTATITSDSWASLAFVVKANTVNNDVYVSTSANITAGGEATTARLTAPSGKTTSDFVTGRRWDDENGTDTTDITTDDYSEHEWSLTRKTGLANNDYFEFRSYAGGSPYDTYTNTPKWTVSVGLSATIGLQTETDSLLAVGKRKVKAIGILTETDTALTATRVKRATAGLLSETDSLQSLARVKRKALGLPSETDSLLASGKVKRKATGLITETDALLSPNRAKNRALGILSETDILFIYGRVKRKATGLLSETDSLFQFTFPGDIVLEIGLQTETDSLLPFTKFKRAGLGIQTEADSLLPFGRVKRKSIGILVEADSLLPAGKAKVKALGLLSESDSLLTALRIKRMGVGILSETDSLLGVVLDTGLILRELLLYPRSAALALDERGAEYTLPQRNGFALAERDGAAELQHRPGAMNLEELEQ